MISIPLEAYDGFFSVLIIVCQQEAGADNSVRIKSVHLLIGISKIPDLYLFYDILCKTSGKKLTLSVLHFYKKSMSTFRGYFIRYCKASSTVSPSNNTL